MAPSTLRQRRGAVTLAFFAYAALPGVWAARIPSVQDARHLSVGVLGLCLLTPAVGAVVALPISGGLVRKWGGRRVLVTASCVMTAALPLLAVAPGVAGFVVALVIFGAAGAAIDVALNVEAVDVEAGYGRSLLAGMHASWSLGALAGTGVGSLTAALGASAVAGFAVSAVAVLVVLLLCARRLRGRPSVGRETVAAPAFAWPDAQTVRLGLLVFCSLFVESAAADWSAVFLHRSVGTSVAAAASGFGAFSAAMVIGRLTGDRVVDRIGATRAVRWAALAGAVILLAAVSIRSYALCLVGFFAAGAGTALLFPMAMVAAGRGHGDPARRIAGAATIGYVGWVLAPGVIGGVAALLSLPIALATASVVLLVAAGMAGELTRQPAPF